jgi:Pentapeptide repeats (8 copies)
MSNQNKPQKPIRPQPTSLWMGLFLWPEWMMEWLLYILSQMAIFEILDILSKLSILVGAIFFIHEAGDRKEQKHLEAWKVIASMRNQPGNGGRISALENLRQDKVPLMGIDVQRAYLSEINLKTANLQDANFSGSALFGAHFENATLYGAIFGCVSQSKSELKCTDLYTAKFQGADLRNAYLSGDLRDTNFEGANLENAQLVKANLEGANFKQAKLNGTHLECVEGLTPEQIKQATNWQDAYYDQKTSQALGLPAKSNVSCSALRLNDSTNRLEALGK